MPVLASFFRAITSVNVDQSVLLTQQSEEDGFWTLACFVANIERHTQDTFRHIFAFLVSLSESHVCRSSSNRSQRRAFDVRNTFRAAALMEEMAETEAASFSLREKVSTVWLHWRTVITSVAKMATTARVVDGMASVPTTLRLKSHQEQSLLIPKLV
jgi:hypothetical protein